MTPGVTAAVRSLERSAPSEQERRFLPLTPPLPEGNEFPSEQQLLGLLRDAGFALEDATDADLGDSPQEWTERADAVDAEVERRHGADPAFRQAQENAKRVGRLLADGALRAWLGVATASPDSAG